MTIPVANVKGIGPKTVLYLQESGITTAEDLIKAGVSCLQQAPGFNETRALMVISEAVCMTGSSIGGSTAKKKKDKKQKNKKEKKKKDKKKKGKGNKKDKGKKDRKKRK